MKTLEGSRYMVKLLPGKSLTLQLIFTARVEATYSFPLNIQLQGYGFSREAGTHSCTLSYDAAPSQGKLFPR